MDNTLAITEKLLDLLKGFKPHGDIEFCTTAQLMEIGERDIAEYERLENQGSETLSHINGLLTRLVSKLQPLIVKEFGVFTTDTIREFLVQFFKDVEEKTHVWQKFIDEFSDINLDLTEEQSQAMHMYLQVLPYLIIGELVNLIGNSYLLLEENSPQIINTLAEMAKEGGCADSSRNN
jgi:hypothetical protein